MVLTESAFQKPYWIRYIEGPTLSRELGSEYDEMTENYADRRLWRIEPQPGYNSEKPVTTADRIVLTVDAPYIRAR